MQVATECLALFGPGVGPYFQASTFLKFDRDGNGTIPLSLFVQYVTQHAGGLQLVSVAHIQRHMRCAVHVIWHETNVVQFV